LLHTLNRIFTFSALGSLNLDPVILPYCMAVLTFVAWGLIFEGQLLSAETE
jgi:hypothetical protein